MKNSHSITPADKELTNMTFRDLQKAVIVRGFPFEEVSKSDYGKLASFFIKNFYNQQDDSLLSAYDDWFEETLKSRGVDETFIHPQLRYSYLSPERESKIEVILTKPTEKPKKEKTTEGIYKGTKKALTFELAKEGLSKQEVTNKVLEQFPDASLKSIGIWYNKAIKG